MIQSDIIGDIGETVFQAMSSSSMQKSDDWHFADFIMPDGMLYEVKTCFLKPRFTIYLRQTERLNGQYGKYVFVQLKDKLAYLYYVNPVHFLEYAEKSSIGAATVRKVAHRSTSVLWRPLISKELQEKAGVI